MMNNRRYKTLICRHFEKNGVCQLAERCGFAHGAQDLRKDEDPLPQQAQYSVINQTGMNQFLKMNNPMYNYKTSLCTNFQAGYCKNGTQCNFAHGPQELRTNSNMNNQQYQQMMMMQQMQMGQGQQQYQPQMQNQLYQQANLQMQPNYQQPQPNPQDTQTQQLETIRLQAMLNIIQQLILIFQTDQQSINKLNQAAQFIWNQMLDQANILVQEVMNDPKRTDQEIEQYTQIFNQTQDSLNKQQNHIMLIQQNNTEQQPTF